MRACSHVLVITSMLSASCSLVLNFDDQDTSIDADVTPRIDASLPGPDATPVCESLLSFHTLREGGEDVYTIKPDGSDAATLIVGPGQANFNTRWSPDGRQLIVHTDRDDNVEVYSIGSDGSELTNLTNNNANDQLAFWSPDGTKILFQSDRGVNQEIYWMNADGTQVTNVSLDAAADTTGRWSPDGTRIYFLSDRNGPGELFSVSLDGGDLFDFKENIGGGDISSYDFSPNGNELVFTRTTAPLSSIFTMNIDGSELTQISSNIEARQPRWLSANRIAFQNVIDGNNTEIFAMDSDGTAMVNLSNDPAVDRGINVELETGRIAFVREQVAMDAGGQEVWVMNSDGSGALSLTAEIDGRAGGPRWRPCQQP